MPQNRPVAVWLFLCCLMVFAMTGIGAITRLTESGLSITEWNVVMGALPPLNEYQWYSEFEKYKASPEFTIKHFWMNVEDFKQIYFWEWFHRLWGRLIGLAFAIPLIYFWLTKKLPAETKPYLLGLLALGAAQGYMGWYMVQSGLVDRPSVSQYRLAAHLSLALIIFSLMFWLALRLWRPVAIAIANPQTIPRSLHVHGMIALLCAAITIIWGAFVAGLDAGMIYNEFPGMGGGLVPKEMWDHQPAWINLFENHASVQFTHRWLAIFTFFVVLSYAIRGFKFSGCKSFGLLGFWILAQVGLGIATLLTQVWIPLAALHQLGAVILLGLILTTLQVLWPARAKISA